MILFQMDSEWRERLEAAGLGDYASLISFCDGKCLSKHPRGKTWRLVLPCGQSVFIKQDFYTKKIVVLRDLLRLRRPEPNTEKERQRMVLAESHGFRVAKVIAYGQERGFLGIPSRAVMVTLPVSGKPLDVFLKEGPEPERARQAIANAEATLTRLQDEGLDWKIDCKPEHFFIDDDLAVSLIDVERLSDRHKPLPQDYRDMQFRRFRSLLPK